MYHLRIKEWGCPPRLYTFPTAIKAKRFAEKDAFDQLEYDVAWHTVKGPAPDFDKLYGDAFPTEYYIFYSKE